MSRPGRLIGATVAAGFAQLTYRRLTTPEAEKRLELERVNHRGRTVTLAQGPATVVGSLVGIALTPGLPSRLRGAGMVAAGAAGALGAYDDLAGATSARGLRGHLSSLARGEVTSGAVKIAGLGIAGLVAGTWSRRGRGGLIDALLAGVVISGGANLVNLFDLRPGRAAKVYLTMSGPMLLYGGPAGGLLAGPTGAVVAMLAEDLSERSMMGDTGANALGAALGTAATAVLPRSGLAVVAGGLVGLTLVSEIISFSDVIERQPLLKTFDSLGRRAPA